MGKQTKLVTQQPQQAIVEYTRFSDLGATRLTKILYNLNLNQAFEDAQHIVIKPNLCAGASPNFNQESGVWTSLEVTQSIITHILAIKSKGKIYVVESDSTGHGYANQKFLRTGYFALESLSERVKLIDLTRSIHKKVEIDRGLYFRYLDIPEILTNGFFYISLSKMKSHNICLISGALKNQFGCLPYMDKSIFHPKLSRVIVDANMVVRPDLCILEALPGMAGNGPVHGRPFSSDIMMFSNDPVAADVKLCRIFNLHPKRVKYICMAADKQIGIANENHIVAMNEKLSLEIGEHNSIPKFQAFFVKFGLLIQTIGGYIERVGHLTHFIKSYRDFAKILKLFRLRV